jgi:phage baseplate assembly protein V
MAQAIHANARKHLTDPDELIRFGRVVSVDHAAGKCVVEIDEDCGPARSAGPPRAWATPACGARLVGEQVLVLCPAGEIGAAIAIGGIACNAFPVPANGMADLIRFKDGAVLSYDPDSHTLAFSLPDGGKLALTGDLKCPAKSKPPMT